MTQTIQKFPLLKIDNETILNHVYLSNEGKNMEIFAALQKGNEAINQFLPNHFKQLSKCSCEVSKILNVNGMSDFSFESEIRKNYTFLMLAHTPDSNFTIINCLNYGEEEVSNLEASIILNIFAYSLLCENSSNETEQYFCAFMVDYLKYLSYKNKGNSSFNSKAVLAIID